MKRRTILTGIGLGLIGLLAGGKAMASRTRGSNRYYSGPVSDHFDGRVFFNPGGEPPGSFRNLLRWQLGGGRSRWPREWPSPYPPAEPSAEVRGEGLRLTMVGHSTMLLQTGGLNILTDPVWSDRVSPVSFAGPTRVNAPGIDFSRLPRIDVVLVSHNHYDHMDIPTLGRLHREHDPVVVTPLGNDTIMRRSMPKLRLAVGDWGQHVDLGNGLTVHIEPTHHWSARGASDRRMALWSAFVVETAAGRTYFAGDTGFHDGINYRAAAEKHGGFRLALLPIGAYEPRWFMKPHHQNPEEAALGLGLLEAAHGAGFHWGTFHLTNESISEPAERLGAALDAAGIARERFRAMLPGEVWDVPATRHADRRAAERSSV